MAYVRNVTTYRQLSRLQEGWRILAVAPGLYQSPEQLAQVTDGWLSAPTAGTVIETLQYHKQWDLAHPVDVEASDWWYRCSFSLDEREPGEQLVLKFAGLATVADIWLNGQHLLHTDNMFCSHEVDVTDLLTSSITSNSNELILRFWSLQSLLAAKRPRPRWRTQLVDHQQLRWQRTTLLGRMPGWSPPVRSVGLWQPVSLERRRLLTLENVSLQTRLDGSSGEVVARVQAKNLERSFPVQAQLLIGDEIVPLHIQRDEQSANSFTLNGSGTIPSVEQWWPHTHGSQPLYAARIVVRYATETVEIDCGRVAFRSVELLRDQPDDFGLRVNGETIFCRGSCWTPLNITTLLATPAEYRVALQLAQQAGMNMLRIGGTMIYEADAFYDLCDELGIMVWQDFMFANMDYPTANEAFCQSCLRECEQLLARLQTHPCLALFCGNSEIEQQVSMLGLSAKLWQNNFFYQALPELCARYVDLPYWPSSPSGGTHPFQANAGNSHYQGVGPFLRPLEDARRSEVRFASECLGFAHVPEDQTLDLFLKPGEVVAHHPKWKARSPRDFSAGWDFDDIRDYYLQLLFHVDPMQLRYSDTRRYLELSRVTTGEVMASVFAEWRRKRSTCHGGLTWFYRDLLPGAGWGIVDATSYPKAAYYYLRRVLLPRTCFFTDEGVNGLWLHLVNDTVLTSPVVLRLSVYRFAGTLMATTTKELLLPARDELEIHIDGLFEGFLDLTYAYRFGPPNHDVVVATLLDAENERVLGESFYFPSSMPGSLPARRDGDIGLRAEGRLLDSGMYEVRVRSEKFAQSVALRAEHFLPEDNYFHVYPGGERVILCSPRGSGARDFRCSISALNSYHEIEVNV